MLVGVARYVFSLPFSFSLHLDASTDNQEVQTFYRTVVSPDLCYWVVLEESFLRKWFACSRVKRCVEKRRCGAYRRACFLTL